MNFGGPEARNGHPSTPSPGPFGYSFLSSHDTPYEPAPAPPPGPALLDDSESTMLDNFFTTLNSNQLDSSDIFFRGQPQGKGAGTFSMEWPDELPPIFEGSATSLSQPSLFPYDVEKTGGEPICNDPEASSDILAAASMLYQNGVGGFDFGSTFSHHLFPDQSFPGMNGNVPIKNLRSNDQLALKNSQPQPMRKRIPQGFHTAEMFFDVQQSVPLDQQTSAKVRTLCWGSDASFVDRCYLAPPDQPNEEECTNDLLNKLECFEPQSSSANTRAPSPVLAGDRHGDWASRNGAQHEQENNSNEDNDNANTRPTKRLKSNVKEENEDSDANDTPSKSRKSKTPSHSKTRHTLADNPLRKPKLQQGIKPMRENLTEEQKRTNHILSEQKRRNLIKQGFDELCSLVPELRGGGFSKSAMLLQAAEWLEDMMHGNEILKTQLSDLKSMNGIIVPR